MAEVKNYIFDYKEVAEALIKKQGIHEGLWSVYMEFGLGAGNVPTDPSGQVIVPAAIVPVVKFGIQRFDKPNSLTVNAAEVNPRPRLGPSSRHRGRAGRTSAEKEEDA
jgi:hypothetical protein